MQVNLRIGIGLLDCSGSKKRLEDVVEFFVKSRFKQDSFDFVKRLTNFQNATLYIVYIDGIFRVLYFSVMFVPLCIIQCE